MYKFISLLLLISCFSWSLAAQNLSIGGEIGLTSSRESRYSISDFDNRRNSFTFGANFNIKFSDHISLTTGLHYLRQGYKHSTCYIFPAGVENLLVAKFDYLTIPLYLNFHFLKSKKLITTIGLMEGFNIKAVQDYPESIGGCEIYYPEDLMDTTKDLNLSAVIGIGYKVIEKNNQESILIFRYIHGLTNNYKNPFGSSVEWKNNTFTISYLHNFVIRGGE